MKKIKEMINNIKNNEKINYTLEEIKKIIHNENINAELEIVENIRELNQYGIMSGVNKERAKEIFSYVLKKEEYKNFGYYTGNTFLGGEDIKEFDDRIKNAINYIVKSSKDFNCIAIVTHGGVYRSIFKNILNIDKKIVGIEDLGTTVLEYNNNQFTVININGVELEK